MSISAALSAFVIAVITALFGVTVKQPANLSVPSPTLITSPVPSSTPQPSTTSTPTIKPTSTPKPTPTPRPTLPPFSGPPGAGLSSLNVSTPKGNFSATVMTFDMSGTRMVTDTANDSDCSTSCATKPLAAFVTANNGFAGVNGSYFCPASYPECGSKTDSFDFPVYNSRLSKWINGGNLSWSNRRAIVYTDGSGAHYIHDSAGFGGGLSAGIINYPGLVNGGEVQIDENQSGLSDKQKLKNMKIGLGVRNTNTIMVVSASNVTMFEFAHVFKSLGATGALNLDTGGSAAMYYGGRYLIGPGRNLPNAVIFVRK